jgi:hypothetical protein
METKQDWTSSTPSGSAEFSTVSIFRRGTILSHPSPSNFFGKSPVLVLAVSLLYVGCLLSFVRRQLGSCLLVCPLFSIVFVAVVLWWRFSLVCVQFLRRCIGLHRGKMLCLEFELQFASLFVYLPLCDTTLISLSITQGEKRGLLRKPYCLCIHYIKLSPPDIKPLTVRAFVKLPMHSAIHITIPEVFI